ncbi:MAG: calcium-binding protein [Cyanobacteria bacterium J06642_9]
MKIPTLIPSTDLLLQTQLKIVGSSEDPLQVPLTIFDDSLLPTQSELGSNPDGCLTKPFSLQTPILTEPIQASNSLFQPIAIPSIPPLYSFFPVNTIEGTSGDDTLYGNSEFAWDPELGLVLTFSNDIIDGLEGDDNLFGQGGNDSLFGREGDDNLSGGFGDDFLSGGVNTYGESGQDNLIGDVGADTFHWDYIGYLDNGTASTVINAGIGNDFIVSGLDSYFTIWDFDPTEGDNLSGFSVFDYEILQTASLGLGVNALDTALVVDTSYYDQGGFVEQYDLVGIIVDWTFL